MAAFDLNSLYFLKNAAPKTTSFEEAAAPIKTGFDLGTAYNENYNRNSLQNLIAQRESEGVPFDRLSNEAAKWDLNAAANIMRPEARNSIDFNFKQSAVEFDRWRKEMARRICGLILQKSDELGMAPDQQYGVLDTAAHYVVTYDPELAEFLMQQANTRRYNAARTAPKPSNRIIKDDHVDMSRMKQKFYDYSKGQEGTKDQRDIAAAEYGRFQMLEDYLGGRYPIYTWMTGYLRGFRRAGGTYEQAIEEIMKNYNPEEQPGYEYRTLRRFPDLENDAAVDSIAGTFNGGVPNNVNKPVVNNVANKPVAGTNSSTTEENKSYSYVDSGSNALGRYSYPKDNAHVAMGKDINEAQTVDQLTNILAAIEQYEGLVPNSKGIESLKNRAQKKIEEFEKRDNEVGNSPEARLFWENLPARAKMASAKQFRNAGVFAAGVISNSPYSVVDNGLMVQSPDYVISEAMQKASKTLNTRDGFVNFMSMLANSGNGYLSTLAKQKTAFDVVASISDAVLKTMRPQYNAMMEGKTEEQKSGLKKFLKGYYGWPDKLFKALEDPNGSLGTAKEIEKRAHKIGDEKVNQYFDDESIVNGNVVKNDVPVATGETLAEKIARRRRERNGGK